MTVIETQLYNEPILPKILGGIKSYSLNISLIAFAVVISISYCSFTLSDTNSNQELLKSSINAIKQVKAAKYTFVNTERIDNELLTGKQLVKWTAKPFQCYLYFIYPNEGSQLVFSENRYSNMAIYYPNGFPYITLKLDPLGELMRKNNHHSVFETGFTFLGEMLEQIIEEKNVVVSNLGDIIWNNKKCYKVQLRYNDFKYISYYIKKEETIHSLAKSLQISEYLLSLKNPQRGDAPLKIGENILVPNAYAKQIELFIDMETLIPVYQRFFDERGVFELYEYHDLIINPVFDSYEFSSDAFVSR